MVNNTSKGLEGRNKEACKKLYNEANLWPGG